MNCPEDVNTYIYRDGRSARYEDGGESLLMLTVHEEKCYVHQLRDRRIPARIQVNDSLLNSIEATMASLLASDPEMKMAALRAFVAYTFLDVSSNLTQRERDTRCAAQCLWVCMCVSVSNRVYMRVSPLHFVSIAQVGNELFREFKKTGYGQTDGRTDRRTDRPSYRDSRTHLKSFFLILPDFFGYGFEYFAKNFIRDGMRRSSFLIKFLVAQHL